MTRSMRALAALAGAAALALATSVSADQTTRYILFTGDGTRGGEQVVQRSDDGRVDVRYIFKNNGRGPELEETIRLAPDGTMAEYSVKGKAEMGGAVQEHFVREGTQAQWQSNAEKGSASVQGPALYVPLSSSFETASIAIGVLAGRPDATLPLLPSGTLHLRKIDEMEVAAKAGQKRRVQLVALTGLGFTPSFYWATTDARPRLFSLIYPGWMTLIEEGFETSTD
ncbi:MAG TPA: amidohydrolase, partial [Albitalea sp.]|nr:amidohydrolase [Albitalea sp.]